MKKENFKPKYGHIPQDVLQRIREEVNRIGYDYIFVLRKSLHPKDKNLYVVIAKKKNSYVPYYSFWSCYNDETQSLNHGHYGYDDWNKCFDAALEYVSEGRTTMNETTENIKKIDKLCKGIKRRFEVIEGNAGDLYLVVFNRDEIDYMKEGYEYQKGSLMNDLKTISEGFTPIETNDDIAFVSNPSNPQVLYYGIIDGDASIIADNNGFYPTNCGKAACYEFGIKKGEIESETKKYKLAVTWEASGFIEVEANSFEDAMRKVKENPDEYSLPYISDYVDGSLRLTDERNL